MMYVVKVVSEVTPDISIDQQKWCRKHPLSRVKREKYDVVE
jgi:hypothetical protein